MKNRINLLIMLISFFSITICNAQTKVNNMNKDTSINNPLICDIETGICDIPGDSTSTSVAALSQSTDKRIKMIYFTDPICSSCWGIEPQLRKLKLEYGNSIEIEYRMG